MARLILTTAEGTQTIELRPINSLGRHPNNSIQLLDKIVSKEHCILEQRETGIVLRDLGSLNGTYINGERVRGEQLLRHGDEISLGSTRARFDDGSGLDLANLPAVPAPQQHPQGPPGQHAPQFQQAWGPPQGHPGPPGPPGAPHGGPPHSQGVPTSMGPHSGPRPPSPSGAGFNALAMQHPAGAAQVTGQMPHLQAMQAAMGTPPGIGNRGTAAMPQQHSGVAGGVPGGYARGPGAGTRVDVLDSARSIGTQVAAQTRGFLPFDQVKNDPQLLRLDYERLRLTWELSRDIGLERELEPLLHKILTSLFKFVNADRGVILLRDEAGALQPRAAQRRDGTEAPIQVSSTILNHVVKERAGVLTHDAAMDFAASKGKSMILNRISSAICAPLVHEGGVLGAIWLDSESLAQFQQKDLELITAVANQAAMFIDNTLLAKKVEQEIVTRERFSRLLSPNVAEQVISGKLEVKKGGVHVPECTVFNSDIRGFTRMSEGATAGVLLDLLNEYFELMVETIFKYEGTLDKFMGDGIMAFWGAPALLPDDPVRAVMCALEQMEVLGKFNRKRMDQGQPPIAVGMGVHTGPLVSGYVGSSKALSYTVIGDTANTSARLCGVALAGQVIVSETTYQRLGGRFEVEELPPTPLKGKERPLRIYNVTRERPSAVSAVSKVG